MALNIGSKIAGLAAWGYGVRPEGTLTHLFSEEMPIGSYLELCRFFVYDWCPPNTASKFLATTHRILAKHLPAVKFLYTYAAGFQGMIGHIYKACGYEYIGRQECTALFWVPNVGLIHWLSIWHRYHLPIGGATTNPAVWSALRKLWPDVVNWGGYNFRYIYWLCSPAERRRLMVSAKFSVQVYPTSADLDIWTSGPDGIKTKIEPAFAKTIPIVKLKTRRAGSAASGTSANHAEGDGATPIPALR